MIEIKQKIVGCSVVDVEDKTQKTPPQPPLLQRPEVLESRTYRLKTPLSENALYITIGDIVVDGRRRPYEIFINSKAMEHFQWIVALTRITSAIFRTNADPRFIVQELKEVFDPRGGYWKKGHLIPSLVAEIGETIERHIANQEPQKTIDKLPPIEEDNTSSAFPDNAGLCPECRTKAVVKLDGCLTCLNCGSGKCQ